MHLEDHVEIVFSKSLNLKLSYFEVWPIKLVFNFRCHELPTVTDRLL